MPAITKQSAKAPARKKTTGSVLDRIEPVKAKDGGVKLLVYGRGKTGKTRLACTFPKPILILGTEDGTRSVSNVKGLDFLRVERSEDVGEAAKLLANGKYKTAVVDTAGGLQDMILKEVLGLEEAPVQKSWGLAKQQEWGIVGAQFKERMRRIIDLADTTDLNVVTIAHERNFNDESNSDLLFPTVGAALTPSAAGWLNGACDYICQTYITREMVEKEIKVNNKTVKTTQDTGRVQYRLRIGPHPVFMTGFRLPEGATLPDAIVDPNYTKLLEIIKGGS